MITEKQIRTALHSEFRDADPSPAVWQGVRSSIGERAPHRRLSRLAVAVVWSVVVLTGGVAVAASPAVQAMVDKYFRTTGIHLVESTSTAPTEILTEVNRVDPAALRKAVPAEMKLPAYLPKPLDGPETKAQVHESQYVFGVNWYTDGGPETPFLALSRYKRSFEGEGTFGPVLETQDVKIDQTDTAAYRDRLGWHILWKLDGTEYHLQATNLPLDEAVKVAASLK